ncbi:acyl-CoA dehydrogenase family protein [Microbacterium sp. MPKO10]|uniref:acyl-CoA dehydrogenase family protein n=1 Tax=Microbacterium sp. MPKO10 TaxID=2989818 RepID=UPI0022369A27|nr:acyl-CoA dehydrogenase family protein [Microbacterium sp. MPKO10]MCW4460029.1 acyl-CoA dehydrogenase family protein [Microbacterium sp. MPKO10]
MPAASDRLETALERLRPVFDAIAVDAYSREQDHLLPRDHVRQLVDAGFGSLRVPAERGGSGLSIPELARVLTELAAADSNLPQIFRGHIAFVEDQLTSPDSPERDTWLDRFVAGEIVGNAWSEVGSGTVGTSQTTVAHTDDGYVVNGSKYYTTGSIYADWTDVTATDSATGESVTALVRIDQTGVTVRDDWNGFGQQLTGTGTIIFENARVEPSEVRLFESRFRYQTALYQLVLLTVLAGVASSIETDAATQITARKRTYSHANADLVRHDAQILGVAGELSAIAFTADATVQHVAEVVQRAFETAATRDSADDRAANVAAEIASAQGQIVLSKLVPEAATKVFDTLGASGISRDVGLDRHWRNARTVVSHNPWIYKARIVGDWSVNGTEPPYVWNIGVAAAKSSAPEASSTPV